MIFSKQTATHWGPRRQPCTPATAAPSTTQARRGAARPVISGSARNAAKIEPTSTPAWRRCLRCAARSVTRILLSNESEKGLASVQRRPDLRFAVRLGLASRRAEILDHALRDHNYDLPGRERDAAAALARRRMRHRHLRERLALQPFQHLKRRRRNAVLGLRRQRLALEDHVTEANELSRALVLRARTRLRHSRVGKQGKGGECREEREEARVSSRNASVSTRHPDSKRKALLPSAGRKVGDKGRHADEGTIPH